MTVSDFILLPSAIVVVVGWFVNSHLNRRHEVAKRRMDYRLETLRCYLSFYIRAQKTKSLHGFDDVQVMFYLYGYDDEIEIVKRIASIVTTTPDNPEWLELLNRLNSLVRYRLRKQLGLSKVKG